MKAENSKKTAYSIKEDVYKDDAPRNDAHKGDVRTDYEQIKVTVIMPVYKVEDYVAKAMDSVIGQKKGDGEAFEGWELIAVDDGSPDRSGEICEEYARRDSRIRIIHQANAGAPAARNRAIDQARGKYLMFLDSDDYCGETMLSDMYELAEENEAQLVISGFYIETYYDLKNGKYMVSDYIPESAVYKDRESFRRAAYKLFDKNMLYPPWNKLYLKSYIRDNGLYFPETFWDDFPFVLSVIREIERVAVTERQYYHFLRARTESETQKYVPKMYEKREEEHGWMVELYKHWGLWYGVQNEQNREMVSRRYIDRLIGCIENLTNKNCRLSRAEKRAETKKMLHSENTAFCLKHARPRSIYSKLMYLPLRWGSTGLCLLEASVITYVKTHDMKLFAKLKTGR